MPNLKSITPQQQKWLVLIGIDFYMPGGDRHDADGGTLKFGSLNGCVRDIHQVQEYFEKQLKVDPSHILKLTSTKPDNGNELPREERRAWPTYENIVNLLERVTREAKTGDLVYIHYSGHGARVKTSYPNLKGPTGYDEAIAPLNIACGGQYLLDVEFAILLDVMVKKGLILTVVLDCCHSGSVTRDGRTAVARGIDRVDETTSRRQDRRLIEVPPHLEESLKKTYRSVDRELWWDPQGYELIAACRLHEKAHEDRIEEQWCGVLTYHLLSLLNSGGPNLTHGMLYRRLKVQITQDWNEKQTPVFAGNSERYFFSSEEAELVQTYAVKKVNGNTLTLDAGRAHGIMIDSEYAIFPWNTDRFNDSSGRPKARVSRVGELESTARLFDLPATDGKIEPGFQALQLKSLVQKLAVKFLSGSPNSTGKTQLDQLHEELNRSAQTSPVQLVPDSESSAKYHIGVDISNKFTLLDTANKPISNFPQSNDPKRFLHDLRHLARYEMFRNLKNLPEPASLKGKYSFEIEGLDPTTSNKRHHVSENSTVTLRFTNKTGMALNITIFNFQPLWGIEKVYPAERDFETVLDNDYEECEFAMSLPENWDPSSDHIDCFKVFITKKPTSFSSLDLPELVCNDERWEPGSTRGENDLDVLLAELDIGDRKGKLLRSPTKSGMWVTSEVEVCTIPDKCIKTFNEEDHRAAAEGGISSDNEDSDRKGNNHQPPFNPWLHMVFPLCFCVLMFLCTFFMV